MKRFYSLLSGGFDSALATFQIISCNEPMFLTPIFFDYGQKSKYREFGSVKRLIPAFRDFAKHEDTHIDDCTVINLEGLFSWSESSILENMSEEGDVGLENRNMVLISCAASMIMADMNSKGQNDTVTIITGFTNGYYDTKLSFVNQFNVLFKVMNQKIAIIAPLIAEGQKEKVSNNKLADIARSLDILLILKRMTWSCYYPQDKECGHCEPCRKRQEIFEKIGMKEVKHKSRSNR